MRVIVTGSSGFIGRVVSNELERCGHAVTRVDLVGEVDAEAIGPDLVRQHDAVCHLAAMGDVYMCQAHPVEATATNVVTTASVAAHCAEAGVRLVHASTWEVDHPHEPYAITKAAAEQMVLWFCQHRGLSGVALRLGSAYGPDMRQSQVIRKFIDMARAGKDLTVHGDGSQYRQWTHVRDIARAFVLAVESDVSGAALPVVAGEAVTIRQIAESVSSRYGVEVTFGESRPADVPPSMVDSSETERVLGWQPTVSFADGLGELMEE